MAIVCMVIEEQPPYSNVSTIATITEDPDDPCGTLPDNDPGYEVGFSITMWNIARL